MGEFLQRLIEKPGTIRKFFVALVSAITTAVTQGLLSPEVAKWVAVIVAFGTMIGIYAVPNDGDGNTSSPENGEFGPDL